MDHHGPVRSVLNVPPTGSDLEPDVSNGVGDVQDSNGVGHGVLLVGFIDEALPHLLNTVYTSVYNFASVFAISFQHL